MVIPQGNTVVSLAPAQTIMAELADCLKLLLEDGETKQLNLTELHLSEHDLDELADYLGVGDVRFTLEDEQACSLRETAYAGIWWVTCYDQQHKVQSESIEVTRFPERLMTSLDDIRRSAVAIRNYQN